MAVQRIEMLGVPVDICLPQDMEEVIMKLTEKDEPSQIVFMTIWDFMKARGNNDYARCVRNADLELPVSKSIINGAKFLKLNVPYRYNPFNATISILSILESHYKSIYLLGGKKKTIMTAEKNVRTTFPNLHIVGRYVGYYPKNVEDDIVSAVHKASPSLVLVSEGVKEKDLWSYQRKDKFRSGIFVYYKDAIGIFGERRSRVSEKTFDKGLEVWSELLRNPLKVVLVFPFILYNILLVWKKFFSK